MYRWILSGFFSFLMLSASGNHPFVSLASRMEVPVGSPEIHEWARSGSPHVPETVCSFADACIEVVDRHRLTGWFFLQSCDYLAGTAASDPESRSRLLWLMLSRKGIGTALYQDGSQIQVLLANQEAVFNVAETWVLGTRYINLTCLLDTSLVPISYGSVGRIRNGSDFRLAITQIPDLVSMQTGSREIRFRYHGRTFRTSLTYNRTYADWLAAVPFTNYSDHILAPMSAELAGSLNEVILPRISSLSVFRKSEWLLAYIRTGFGYRDESVEYLERPLGAEQMIMEGMGDCEDRTALFYALAVQFLNVPVAVVDFTDHQGVALGIPSPYGEEMNINGFRMKYCEPTDVQDILRAGESWKKYQGADYRIFALHEPTQ